MQTTHFALFHERFVFRFGVDRVLLCLARELKLMGFEISLFGNRFDDTDYSQYCDHIFKLPESSVYIESDITASRWIQENWGSLSPNKTNTTAAIVAGWPFFQSISTLTSLGVKVYYQDHGINPSEGMPEGAIRTLGLITLLKQQFLRSSCGVIAVSHFIAESQSRLSSQMSSNVHVIHNASDHVRAPMWEHGELSVRIPTTPFFFSIGRFETGSYKQSDQVFEFARKLSKQLPECKIFILAPEDTLIPQDCKNTIIATGLLPDRDLFQLIQKSLACICFSRWEGFNLPLAEAQALGRPCLVYNIGAHPEVVAHPWLLAESLDAMVLKALSIARLLPGLPNDLESSISNFADSSTWKNVARKTLDIVTKQSEKQVEPKCTSYDHNRIILVDVSNACRDTANSGVVRVTRQLSSEIAQLNFVIFVCWDSVLETFRFPTQNELSLLERFGGPQITPSQPVSPSSSTPALLWNFLDFTKANAGWIILPEIKTASAIEQILKQAQVWNLHVAAIFYDAIPVKRPEFVKDPAYRIPHSDYMKKLAECDLVLSISESSRLDLLSFWADSKLEGNAVTCLLPAGFRNTRPTSFENQSQKSKMILCVSTLEPRKNHKRLVEAFLEFFASKVGEGWKLLLVGNRYAGAFEIAEEIQEISSKNPCIQYLGVINDEDLNSLYKSCEFTIYPSEIEGFGLPILESIWHNKPCICNNRGVMAELAKGGGCLLTDVTDVASLSRAIHDLACDPQLSQTLRTQATDRALRSWRNYADEFISWLHLTTSASITTGSPISTDSYPRDFDAYIYSDCVMDCWQMSNSEKTALAGILARHKPKVAIEIGTFRGGSLSLIRQYSEKVFSIDIDEAVSEKYSFMDNVEFITGDSRECLPFLLNELKISGLSPSFILVDGDHSECGVKSDLEAILNFIPEEPLIIMMHDMGNAECRKGAESVMWERSPYVHYVDLDFVPGRITEHFGSGSGTVWGGLGLVFMTPATRSNRLTVGKTFQRSLAALWAAQTDGSIK